MSKILVTGGAGYTGCVLVPKLLDKGYGVRVLDTMWFTDKGLDSVKNKCEIVKGDIRDVKIVKKCMQGVDAVIHLANISNDPCSELDHQLTKEVNFEATKILIDLAKSQGVKRFIYASSGSVYGIKDFDNVTEDVEPNPLTIYSKTKVWSEEIVKEANTMGFTTVCVRPGTHCGYSPRQRLDLITNILATNAIKNKKMMVNGGNQKRPSIHIEDITDYYVNLITAPAEKIGGEIFNANSQNLSIGEIAQEVKNMVGGDVVIDTKPHPDQRSYPMVSKKIEMILGFSPKKTVGDAVSDLKYAFEKSMIKDPEDPIYKNILQMRKLNIGVKPIEYVQFVDLSTQWKRQRDNIHMALDKILKKGDYILGKAVKEFEEKIAEYCGTKYAIGVNSGTDALKLAMKSMEIGPGDEVITVSNSFIATVGAIVELGATPVLVDVGEDYLIDPDKIEKAITSKTKAIIPVHLAGRIADMNLINLIAEKYRLVVIEDACQAIGSEYYGRKAGSLGDFGCFSLHPLKILNVLGDGGFITLNNEELYQKLKRLRNHGLEGRDMAPHFGCNSRLDSFQAAIALEKLQEAETTIKKRTKNANLYFEHLKGVKFPLPTRFGCKDNWNTFIIRAGNRDKLHKYLLEKGIKAKVHYEVPIHLQEAAKNLGYGKGSLPETEIQANEILSLPSQPELTEEEIFKVINHVNEFTNKK
ncbi:MAG: bifunctional SDR family oxidoreductase/aminotransferase class I/II-fold pyridoxal phosphate-dependent enzyme [archaeon]